MCDYQELEAAFDRLIKPRPLSPQEIAERCRAYRYYDFGRDEVPDKLKQGWEFACGLDGDRVLLHWPHCYDPVR